MSRSFTPKELHMADKICHFSQQTIKMIESATNSEVILYDVKSEFSKTYPNLSFLLSNSESELKNISDTTLTDIEYYLNDIINHIDNHITFQPDDKLSETILKWFNGELDATFYYAETNNRMFIDYIISIDNISKEEKTP